MQAAKILGAAVLALSGVSSHALNIVFDYSQDTQNFFSADKRAVLAQVASIFENNLGNSLAPLNNVNVNSAGMSMGYDPSTGRPLPVIPGSAISAPRQNIAADTLLVYVGAADLPASTLGLAWIDTADPNRVNRAQNGFGSGWGGQLMFDTTMDMSYYGAAYAGQTALRNWYVDDDIRSAEAMAVNLLPVTPGRPRDGFWQVRDLDFASVVMHEMGHMFGLQHSANSDDAMYSYLNSERNLFDANDWNAMRAQGWQVLSNSPDLYSVVSMPVPEPSSYAMLLAGLAGIGWVARRRR